MTNNKILDLIYLFEYQSRLHSIKFKDDRYDAYLSPGFNKNKLIFVGIIHRSLYLKNREVLDAIDKLLY